jgi:hypothetical protein
MDRHELTSLLEKLRSELESGQAVDGQLRQSLNALEQDIQRVLAQASSRSGEGAMAAGAPFISSNDESLSERAQEIEARFATEHPYLANTLRDVMDTLGKMGI